MLSYITVGGDTPKNKLNILLLPHPTERAILVEAIADDILSTLDCAVWYGEADETEYPLDDMNLIVVPVTNLLLRDFSAVSTVVDDAKQSGVPVLPILVEAVSPIAYECVFANTQFIDKHSRTNPLGYYTLLENYFSNYKRNADLDEKIHASFDVKAFVSYRHKDRRLMHDLLRQIHDNPRLVDVAVWYDDKLTAGKDFNDEILASVRAADVFILAVTPSLLEKGNYIEKKEYPTAVKAGIPILPVMVEDTPLEPLYTMYPGLPEPCSLDMLEPRLRDLLGGRLDKDNDNDAEHLFYMGLAYFFGTGVEIDRVRAKELLIRADELGYYEAARWLAVMFVGSSDDATDPNGLLEYYERYCIACHKLYRDNPENTEVWLYFCMSARLYLSYITKNKLGDELNICSPYVKSCIEMFDKTQSVVAAEKFVEAMTVSYRYMLSTETMDSASQMLDALLSFTRSMWANGEDNSMQMYVSALVEASKFELEKGNKIAAEEHIFTALTVLEAASEYIPDTDRKFRELAVKAYNELCSLCLRLEDYASAASAAKKEAELYESLSLHNSQYNFRMLIYSLLQLSFECYFMSDQIEEAEMQLAYIRNFLDKNTSDDREVWLEQELTYLISSASVENKHKHYKAAEQIIKKAEALAKENESLVSEKLFFEIHQEYSYIYFCWGKQYLAEYHDAIILQNYRNMVIERGSEEDYKNFANALPTPSNALKFRSKKWEWQSYKALANEGTVKFYPDDSHLEKERDVHLGQLLRDGLAGTVCTVLLVLYIILDYHFAFLFKERLPLCLAMFVAWVYAGPTPIKLVLYGYYKAQRGREYSALWAFKFSGLVKKISVVLILLITVLTTAVSVVIFAFPAAVTLPEPVLFCVLIPLAFVHCTISLLNVTMEDERLRTFWRISRMKPLSEQPGYPNFGKYK